MKEFAVYDQMMAQYYKSISTHILPLFSWEFYGEHFSAMSSFKEDLEMLKKITQKWNFDRNYQKELINKKSVIVITNTKLTIVYASHNIEKMNGYTPEEIIGSSPKMFQGANTCNQTSKMVRQAVKKQQPFEVSILNYKKDKSTYVCNIKGFPVLNKRGKLVNYIAFETAA
ncbi:PAS domain-containing protein [Aquimarina sp. RZ0]|uniref:PAS domain-containing protein n=1 Tax=Aquimarina sp. RZ0 TaxID=2607730 RepID=UPI0011F3A5E4|nr:PAS domain-containing protein [Aquimarina sp. RZ0]KAA1243925.1 PAS domain-containing protein [Aquimarina sp. RZ0]